MGESLKILRRVDFSPLQPQTYRRCYYAGMGGSSLAADLLNDYFQGDFHLEILRNYHLPPSAGPQDLVICASYSGNTEETLAIFHEALRRDCPVIVLSHEGQLTEEASRLGLCRIPIPACIQPRCAIGYFFTSLMASLNHLKIITFPETQFHDLARFLENSRDYCEAQGQKISEFLKDRVPIIYGAQEFYAACRIWKIKFNENTKIPSFFNVFPELNHNEMVGFTHRHRMMDAGFVYLSSEVIHPRILQRMHITREILSHQIPVYDLVLRGQTWLEAIFESLWISDYSSYFLALSYGINPGPVEMIEEFKRRMRA